MPSVLSVSSYLSVVVWQLEIYYPSVQATSQSPVIKQKLPEIQQVHSLPVHCKEPLTIFDLQQVFCHFSSSMYHNNFLFVGQLFVGFDQLLCLAELCISNNPWLFDVQKPMKHFDIVLADASIKLLLPVSKLDQFF